MRSYELDEQGRPPRPPEPAFKTIVRYTAAGTVTLIVVVLAVRALVAPAEGVAPAATVVAPSAAPVAAATLPPLNIPTWTPRPDAPTAAPVLQAPTAAPPTPDCPAAAPLQAGERAGWLARAEGCPTVLFASVGGERRWVLKPDNFPEGLYEQLPAVQP